MNFFLFPLFIAFFRAHRMNDLTKKLEKVGPFECDELEKHCRAFKRVFTWKIWRRYSRERGSLSLGKMNKLFNPLLSDVVRALCNGILLLPRKQHAAHVCKAGGSSNARFADVSRTGPLASRVAASPAAE